MSDEGRTVTIDRLVLRGVALAPGQGERVRALVEAELARRLNAPGAEEGRGVAAPEVSPPTAALRDPVRLAGSVAEQVARTINGKVRP